MDRYWDLSESQRAALSHEQVKGFLAVELMERGVLFPQKPELDPVPPGPNDLDRVTLHAVRVRGRYGDDHSIAFFTPSAAQAFLDLAACSIAHDYETGVDVAHPIDPQIHPIEAIPEIAHSEAKGSLAARKSAMDHNKKLTDDYAAATAKVERETKDIWNDWRACREKDLELRAVRRTFDEYLAHAKGDRTIARTFLEKAYPSDKVREALGELEATSRPAPERNGAASAADIPF